MAGHPVQEAPLVCRYLRAKSSYGNREGGEDPWRLADPSTMVFRCARTLQTWGPDGNLAEFYGCRAGRGCFVDQNPATNPAPEG